MGEAWSESIHEVGQCKFAIQQVLVVFLGIGGQLAHQGGVDLFQVPQRLATAFQHVLVPGLPALELFGSAAVRVIGEVGGDALRIEAGGARIDAGLRELAQASASLAPLFP